MSVLKCLSLLPFSLRLGTALAATAFTTMHMGWTTIPVSASSLFSWFCPVAAIRPIEVVPGDKARTTVAEKI